MQSLQSGAASAVTVIVEVIVAPGGSSGNGCGNSFVATAVIVEVIVAPGGSRGNGCSHHNSNTSGNSFVIPPLFGIIVLIIVIAPAIVSG